MGEEGARLTRTATATAEWLVEELQPLGEVTSKKMFGGYGVFESGVMFALVDSEGVPFLRADDALAAEFESAGSTRHARMPYFEIPTDVGKDGDRLRALAERSLAAARAAKKA